MLRLKHAITQAFRLFRVNRTYILNDDLFASSCFFKIFYFASAGVIMIIQIDWTYVSILTLLLFKLTFANDFR